MLFRLLLAQLISFRRQLSTAPGDIFCWKVLLLQLHALSILDRMPKYVCVYIICSVRTFGKY